MGNTNACCGNRSNKLDSFGISNTGEQNHYEMFRHDLLDKYDFYRIDFSTFSGATEALVLTLKNNAKRSPPILL